MMGAYDALEQEEQEQDQEQEEQDLDRDQEDALASVSALASQPPQQPAPLRDTGTGSRGYTKLGPANGMVFKNLVRRNASTTNYEIVEADDYEEEVASSTAQKHTSPTAETFPIIPRPRPRRLASPAKPATAESTISSTPSQPVLRTASGRSIALRHPTPDLQTLQGAYTSNIEHLEKTAERLSMTSSIEDAIKELHDEQKRSDSRRSSLLSSQSLQQVTRQVSNASSIVKVNSAARSGGFSPAGYIMSPGGSFTTGSGRGRSLSKGSRFRPEPELEGRPLDSFVNMQSAISPTSPTFSPSASIAEMNEQSSTITKPIVDLLASPEVEENPVMANEEQDRPTTSASINTFEQEKMFADFDGIHSAPPQQRTVSRNESNESNSTQRRVSSGNRLSMARPQSYADPSTGQQMVYYPAPVPMMLNLPQKLSKNPSSQARNKRRSQVLSSIPPAARQSAIWLPDVLEDEDAAELGEDDQTQQQEYIPQHQRASMGGRRLTQDLSHLPAQLRASAYFELPAANQTIELKEQSAVATLDSILDASAYAPVSAFTDHAFAGHLGAEVYGRERMKHNRASTTLAESQSKKRTSTFNILLRGRRGSSTDVLDSDQEKRRATMSGLVESKVRLPIEDEDEQATSPLQESEKEKGEDGEESDEGQLDDEIYHGPPTTLLAELQLRKQQQKQRTRPLLSAFPNGMHSTLLEMDAVAQVEQKSRKQKRVNLAWEDPSVQQTGEDMEDDEDIPLAMLYAKKEARDPNRPMGLMERRDMEDNEPLSRRRDRLQGRQPMLRASTMMHISSPVPPEEEGETLAERVRRLKEQTTTEICLPAARPVSGDFTSELMFQFGGDALDVKDPKDKGKETTTSPGPEEEETLGQRRKRLQAERAAREKEVGAGAAAGADPLPQRSEINKRRSMADILQAHPAAGASRNVSYEKPVGGLLGLHEKASAQRSSTMLDFNTAGAGLGNPGKSREVSGGFRNGVYNDGQGGIIPPQQQQQSAFNVNGYGNQPMFPQPSLGNAWGNQMFANPYAVAYPGMQMAYMPGMPMNGMNMNMNMNMAMGMGMQPLNQGQIDMVERWRQSVMQ